MACRCYRVSAKESEDCYSVCSLGCCGLSDNHCARERQGQSVAVLVDDTLLICECDFLSAKAARFELRNAHLAFVAKCEGFHVAEYGERVADRVGEAVYR